MQPLASIRTPRLSPLAALSLLAVPLALAACTGDDGKDGAAAPVPLTPTELGPRDDAPGVVVTILGVSGASGAGGNFQVGDRLAVRFSLKKKDGSDWKASELGQGRILVSGPTFNYQPVLAQQSDLLSAARDNGDGSYTYTFADPIPATYLPPLNDTPTFGALDGELAGQPLLAGTYTVGIYTRWDYTVESQAFRDVGDATFDFLLGNAAVLQPRALVAQENCNQCHSQLQAHGGSRRNVTLCLLCHTAGAEDGNNPAVAGGTPDVTIAFEVMIHKIHNGEHLPSVQGIGVMPSGVKDYGVASRPYEVLGFRDSVHDYSEVAFPAWPNLNIAMPRDAGYTALSMADPVGRAKEDAVLTGVTSCYVCHGDPDGSGPLGAPAQGDVAYGQPSRAVCGSCHDDIDWTLPYQGNSMLMPAQNDDSACTLCHMPSGDALAVMDGHLHPLRDPAFAPGLNFEILAVEEAVPGNGQLETDEAVSFSFRLTDDAGADIDASTLNSMNVAISGPTSNLNLVHYVAFPTSVLSGPQPYQTTIPERVWYESVGVASGALDSFATARMPHWNVSGATTDVLQGAVDPMGGNSTLAVAADAPVNWLDVQSAASFARNDYIVVDRGLASEEVLRIQYVEGTRLWFSSLYSAAYAPGPVQSHAAGASVEELTVTPLTVGVGYDLDASTGTVSERAGSPWADGDLIVVTYTADFRMPARYPVALNGSPDLDARQGSWSGLELIPGTYTLGAWGVKNRTLALNGESNAYREVSPGVRKDFLFGSATTLEPYDLISSAATCNACHQDLWFHGGGRRGFDNCILCHGTAGSQDRPQYVAAGAPATDGLTVNFRTMLHKIHAGADLANASSYAVVGFGGAPYPNNYGLTDFATVGFPVMPDGVKECASCHGSSLSWEEPAARNHPDVPAKPSLSWTVTCGSCHDSDAAQAHIEIMTSPSGRESCAICHSVEEDLGVPLMHKVR